MKPFENRGMSVRSFLLLSVLAGSVAVAAAQHDKKSSSSPAPAYHPSAPQHAPASRSAPPTRPPMTNTRPSNGMGTRPSASTMGGRMNPGTMGRPGTTTGRTGAPGNMNHSPSSTMNRSNSAGNINNSRGSMTNGSPNSRMATRANMVNRPLPGRQVSLRGGGSAVIRPNGQIRSITRNGMQINHGINGSRTVVSYHNGARVVTTGRNSGYIQRPYVTRGGNTYVSRTVVVNNVTYTRVYRSYSYGGYCCYYGYRPAFYYAPVYYGWAYNPWPVHVYYSWGWGGAPWYGYYGGYFAPYPVYPSAAFWLTDYLIAANLQAAYQAQAAANVDNSQGDQQPAQPSGNDNSGSNSGQVTLTPEVKEAIAEEVKAQLAAQQAAAQQASASTNQTSSATPSQEVPAALDPSHHTFIVASDLTVSSNGQECQLTAGDVIKRSSDTPDEDRKVTAVVSASKKSDCAVGQEIAIGVDDLQEMHNKFEEQLDNGMKDLSEKQGQHGIPKAPDTKTTPSDVPPPPPDNNAAKTLQEQQSAADQSETQVMKEAFSQGS
jgi:hypothetical protein